MRRWRRPGRSRPPRSWCRQGRRRCGSPPARPVGQPFASFARQPSPFEPRAPQTPESDATAPALTGLLTRSQHNRIGEARPGHFRPRGSERFRAEQQLGGMMQSGVTDHARGAQGIDRRGQRAEHEALQRPSRSARLHDISDKGRARGAEHRPNAQAGPDPDGYSAARGVGTGDHETAESGRGTPRHPGRRGHRVRDEGRRGKDPAGRLRGLYSQADLDSRVHARSSNTIFRARNDAGATPRVASSPRSPRITHFRRQERPSQRVAARSGVRSCHRMRREAIRHHPIRAEGERRLAVRR